MSVYRRYTREDALCQSNGYFSLNLREGAIDTIDALLCLDASRPCCVAWVGCGDGRGLLSIAIRHPDVSFGVQINPVALEIARQSSARLG